MIPMRRFLREHQISGEVTECAPDPQDSSPLDGASYRIRLTDARNRRFETQIQRLMGGSVPTLGEGLAEIARRTARTEPVDVAGGATGSGERTSDATGTEAAELRKFLGDAVHDDLMFEFGRRPEEQVEQGDSIGNPARPDEMTNQEPDTLTQAQATTRWPRATRYLAGVPFVAAGIAVTLLARGRRAPALAAAGLGILTSAVGAVTVGWWYRRQQHQAVKSTLEALTDQQTAIQTDGPPSQGS